MSIINSQLKADIEKLLSYDEYNYYDFTTDYDENLGYILDVKDNSYFYFLENERNSDYEEISKVIEEKFNIL